MLVTRLIFLCFCFAVSRSALSHRASILPLGLRRSRRSGSRKLRNSRPTLPRSLEHTFDRIEDVVDRLFGNQAGFRPVLGNLATGSGFAGGVEYYRPYLANGNMAFRTSCAGSISKYWLADAQLSFPNLARGHAFAELYGVHRNYPSINYYGPGPDSKKTGRTDFLLEDTSFDLTAGSQAHAPPSIRSHRRLPAGECRPWPG